MNNAFCEQLQRHYYIRHEVHDLSARLCKVEQVDDLLQAACC